MTSYSYSPTSIDFNLLQCSSNYLYTALEYVQGIYIVVNFDHLIADPAALVPSVGK